jgi:ATP-dependent Zn protease
MVKQQNKEETLNYKQLYEEALLDIDKKQKEIDNLNNTVKSYRFQIYGENAYEIFGYENKSSKKFDEWIVKNLTDLLNYQPHFPSQKYLDDMENGKSGIGLVIISLFIFFILLFILLLIFLDYCIYFFRLLYLFF